MSQEKAIGYIRVSTEHQDEKRQQELIEAHCLKNDLELIDLIVEKGISGAKENREGVLKLMSLSKETVDIVIISETSRLSREDNLLSLVNHIDQLLKANIDVLFLMNGKKLVGGRNLDFAEIIILIAEAKANADERRKIVERCQSGKETKVKQGCFTGHAVPFGFKIIPNPKRIGQDKEFGKSLIVIDETKRQTIEYIYDLVGNKGYSTRKAAKLLNDLNIDYNGEKWDYHRVRTMLYHKTNMGNYTFKDSKGKIEPIVTQELFDRTILNIKKNQLFINKGTKHYNVLKGLLKCPCGSYYYQAISKTKQYYLCNSKTNNEDSECRNSGINIDFLNKIVWITVRSYLNKTEYAIKSDQAQKIAEEKIENMQIAIKKQQKNVIAINRKIDNLLELAEDAGKETRPLYENKMLAHIERRKGIYTIIENINNELIIVKKNAEDLKVNPIEVLDEKLTEKDLHDVYKKYISSIFYISTTPYKGFIHFIFSNGIEVVYATQTMHKKIIIEVPNSSWIRPEGESCMNYKDKKVVVYGLPATDPEFPLSIMPFQREELTHEETLAKFDTPDFRIELN